MDYAIDMEAFREHTMMDFKDSFKVIIGTNNPDTDLLDNRYISVKVNEMSEHGSIRASDIKLRKCDRKQDLETFMDPKVAAYYPNALCFEDYSKIRLHGNWFDSYYKSIYFTIERCRNNVIFPNKCESP